MTHLERELGCSLSARIKTGDYCPAFMQKWTDEQFIQAIDDCASRGDVEATEWFRARHNYIKYKLGMEAGIAGNVDLAIAATRAFEIMSRRGWGIERIFGDKWAVLEKDKCGWLYLKGQNWIGRTPYEAAKKMIEADEFLGGQP